VRRTPETHEIAELQVFNRDWDKEFRYDFEICYWRKCWNVRHMVMDRVAGSYDNFEVALTKDDIDNIIDGLNSFNGANWDLDGGSIWEWDGEWGYSDYIQQNIEDLKLLRQLMDKYELEVYFYDRY
jgi:hypothetical protein